MLAGQREEGPDGPEVEAASVATDVAEPWGNADGVEPDGPESGAATDPTNTRTVKSVKLIQYRIPREQ